MRGVVRQIMQWPPVFIHADDSLYDAMRMMSSSKISHLPVVGNDFVQKGVVSKADVLERLNQIMAQVADRISSSKMILATKVQEIMTKNAVVVQPDDAIDDAVEILLRQEFNCVPVVDDNVLVGVVTSFDLLRGYHEKFG